MRVLYGPEHIADRLFVVAATPAQRAGEVVACEGKENPSQNTNE